ncbi:protein kinase [Endozoicomonas sp. OPT23]|uniref:protein kinase domain-containing protein n=1 Tax=Endozoicomonas sp. OPT23 TaxID=2072845 RepID=UPI001891096A|nr:protein kinase [Endozoicomonas sp. OPT23]
MSKSNNGFGVLDKIGIKRFGKLSAPGVMATVYEGLDTTADQKVAIKKVAVNDLWFTNLERGETEGLKATKHPNIAKTRTLVVQHKAKSDTKGEYLVITDYEQVRKIPKETFREYKVELVVSDFIEGENLQVLIEDEALPDANVPMAIRIGIDVASGLSCLHNNNIIHRDLKPGNIMWNSQSEQFQLIDFGFSKSVGKEDLTKTSCGSGKYLAPEMIKVIYGRRGVSGYGQKLDVWALGATLMGIAGGKTPESFSEKGVVDTPRIGQDFRNILYFGELNDQEKMDYIKRYFNDVYLESPGLVDLIILTLRGNPNERITAAKACEFLTLLRDNPTLRFPLTSA